MNTKLAAKDSLKIIKDELKDELNLIPLENESRSKIQSFAIGSEHGKQFLLVTGDNTDAQQTRIITEKISFPPSIDGVELYENSFNGSSIKRQKTGLKFKNNLKDGNQTSFIVSNTYALKQFIKWYANSGLEPETNLNNTPVLTNPIEQLIDSDWQNDKQSKDIIDISQQAIDSTTKEQIILARLGQGKFRLNVIKTWGIGERCLLTGIEVKQLLIASHIIPWRESDDNQRLIGTNGILLCSHFDKLFDQQLIAFDHTGRLAFSKRLKDSDLKHLESIGVHNSLILNTNSLSFGDRITIFNNLKSHHEKMLELDEK